MATGVLGWPPSEAYAADPQLILLAIQARREEGEFWERVILKAGGFTLPPPPRTPAQIARDLRRKFTEHNANLDREKKRKAAKAAK